MARARAAIRVNDLRIGRVLHSKRVLAKDEEALFARIFLPSSLRSGRNGSKQRECALLVFVFQFVMQSYRYEKMSCYEVFEFLDRYVFLNNMKSLNILYIQFGQIVSTN